jgi:flavodoxin
MKKLVIYYSYRGYTKSIAEVIAKAVEGDTLEIRTKEVMKMHDFLKNVQGKWRVIKGLKPELQPIVHNPKNYDIIFIGTPVWAGSFASPFNTFFSSVKLSEKKIALFCCSGGSKGNTLEDMRMALAGNDILGEIDFIESTRHNQGIDFGRVTEWATEIISFI